MCWRNRKKEQTKGEGDVNLQGVRKEADWSWTRRERERTVFKFGC